MAGDNEIAEKNQAAKEGESSAKDTAESARNELLNDAFDDYKSKHGSSSDISLGGKASDDRSDLYRPKMDDLGDLLGPPGQDGPRSDDEHWYLRGVGAGGEGDHQLPTGDRLQRDSEGNETLTTPDGSKLTVNKDGTYKVEGEVASVEEGENGSRTVTFADGSKVKFGPGGIQQISRGKAMVKFITPGAKLPSEPDDPMGRRPVKFPPFVSPGG
ncbi:MAG: hypothetical protein K2X77_21490 [Candidatus Obscuribacterales bacterium]|jgi:hypothetical protein|nr:hypothetical protein [Candidatus Obscuribacterales bacterium]